MRGPRRYAEVAELAADNKLVVIPAFETEKSDWAHLATKGKKVRTLQTERQIQYCATAVGIPCYAALNGLERCIYS